MSTDYDNYAIVWGCTPLPENQRRENFWALTRQPFMVLDNIQRLINAVIDNNFERNLVRQTRQGIM